MGSGSVAAERPWAPARRLPWPSQTGSYTRSGRDVAVARTAETIEHGPVVYIMTKSPWASAILPRLERLVSLDADWDAEGGRPPSAGVVAKSLDLLSDFMGDNTRVPSVVPTPRGGLSLEWHTARESLEVEVPETGPTTVYYRHKDTGEEWDDSNLSEVRGHLRSILERMTRT